MRAILILFIPLILLIPKKSIMGIKVGLMAGAYLFFCVLVAIGGRKTVIGFWGVFLLSILLTPFILAFFILIFRNN